MFVILWVITFGFQSKELIKKKKYALPFSFRIGIYGERQKDTQSHFVSCKIEVP